MNDEKWEEVAKAIEANTPGLKIGERLTREEAEKNRRALEVLKEKSEQHGRDALHYHGIKHIPEYYMPELEKLWAIVTTEHDSTRVGTHDTATTKQGV